MYRDFAELRLLLAKASAHKNPQKMGMLLVCRPLEDLIVADKADVKAETRQESKPADHIDFSRIEVDAQMRELGKRAIPLDTTLPKAFTSGGADLTIVDKQIDAHIAAAKAKMTPEQLARAEKAADLPHRVVDAASNNGVIPEVSSYRRNLDATSDKAQAAKVDREISGHIADARAKMTPEQLARAEKAADLPYRVIEAAGNRGQIPEVSAHRRAQEVVSGDVARQADVNRWIAAAGRIGEKSEVTARPGETYSSIASNLIAEREGRRGTKTEVHVLATAIAEYNGKTGEQANSLKVNEVVKLPPMRKAV